MKIITLKANGQQQVFQGHKPETHQAYNSLRASHRFQEIQNSHKVLLLA